MPELPELLHVQSKLRELVVGRHVTAERVREPVVLRFCVRGNLSARFWDAVSSRSSASRTSSSSVSRGWTSP